MVIEKGAGGGNFWWGHLFQQQLVKEVMSPHLLFFWDTNVHFCHLSPTTRLNEALKKKRFGFRYALNQTAQWLCHADIQLLLLAALISQYQCLHFSIALNVSLWKQKCSVPKPHALYPLQTPQHTGPWEGGCTVQNHITKIARGMLNWTYKTEQAFLFYHSCNIFWT